MARRLAAAMVAAAMLAGACSSSGGAGAATPGVTATEIHVGALLYGAFYSDGLTGAMARFKRANDAGGIDGRKIVVTSVEDDQSNSTSDLGAAKRLVEQDNVLAVVPVLTQTFAAASYLNAAKVPFFGWSIQPVWCNLQYGFGFTGNDCDQTHAATVADTAAVEQNLFPDHDAQGKTVALIGGDADSAREALSGFAADWRLHGAKVVLQATNVPAPPAVVADYTPFAEQIMASNGGKPPDLIIEVLAAAASAGISKKLLEIGYEGIIQGFTSYDPRTVGSAKGVVSSVGFEPYQANTPAVQQLETDVHALKPGALLTQPLAAGYWSADLFVAALERAGRDLTRQSLAAALNRGFRYQVPGGTAPVDWPQDHAAESPCAAYVKGDGTAFIVEIPLTCAPLIPNPALHAPS